MLIDSSILNDRRPYTVKWNLSELFSTEESWECEYGKLVDLITQYDLLKGNLHTADGILQFLSLEEEVTYSYWKLYGFAYLSNSLDSTNQSAIKMLVRLENLFIQYSCQSSIFYLEINLLPVKERELLFSHTKLNTFSYALSSYLKVGSKIISHEVKDAVSFLSPSLSQAVNIYNTMMLSDISKTAIILSDEKEYGTDFDTYVHVINSNISRKDKIIYEKAFSQRYKSFENTFASIMNLHINAAWGLAQIEGYRSVLEYILYLNDIESSVYKLLMSASNDGYKLCNMYFSFKKRYKKLDVIYPFELASSLSEFKIGNCDYNTIVKITRDSLMVLGNEYIALFDKMVSSGHIDTNPAMNKKKGGFTFCMQGVSIPFILLNLRCASGDEVTFAHEIGHAIYGIFTEMNQPSVYFDVQAFLQEIPSTVNEFLILDKKVKSAPSKQEKIYYLEQLIDMICSGFYLSTIYAEFERLMYAEVESGGILNVNFLNNMMQKLLKQFYGDSISDLTSYETQWIGVSHFYNTYYIFQYATSIAYAISIISKIMSNDTNEINKYISFLKSGASNDPIILLRELEVNILDKNTYQKVNLYFEELINEYMKNLDCMRDGGNV